MAITTDNGKLSVIEWDNLWEPALPLAPGTIGSDDQQQLLWGFSEVSWAEIFENNKLALMEWCSIWEPGIPVDPGTLGTDDQQQLLWGYPGIAWGAPVATATRLPVGQFTRNVGRLLTR